MKKMGEYRKSSVFAGYHNFAPAGHIERYMEGAIFRFHKTKKDYPIMTAINLFGNIINIHPFEDENGRICCLILGHVLIQMKCCLFPVILSPFHRRGMIIKSLVHCWDNFEQNARMLARCSHKYWLAPTHRSKMTLPVPEIIMNVF